MTNTQVVVYKQKMQFGKAEFIAIVLIMASVLVYGYQTIQRKNIELAQAIDIIIKLNNENFDLNVKVANLKVENAKIQAKFDNALIQESTVTEAANNHIVKPTVIAVKNAATSVKTTFISAKDSVVTWVHNG